MFLVRLGVQVGSSTHVAPDLPIRSYGGDNNNDAIVFLVTRGSGVVVPTGRAEETPT